MTDILQNTSLDTQVFGDELDFKTLENILETLDYVEVKKNSRQEFNNLKGNFLVENGQDEKGEKKYILNLPEDLKIYELPAIIRRINRKTFGKENPLYASTKELQIKIAIIYKKLLEQLKNNKNNKILQKALKKYYLLYQNLLPEEKKNEANNLNKENYLDKIIKQGDKDKYKKYQEKITKIKTQENLSKFKDEIGQIDNILGQEIENHLYESLFEKGINMLRLGMETLTQAELQIKMKYLEENGFKKEEEYGKIMGFIMKKIFKKQLKITYRKGEEEVVVIRNNLENFDKKEILLRKKIGIDKIKHELEEAREEKNQEKINKLELDASNKIIKILYETYPYYLTKENNGYQANKIKEFKETFCVGFSLLGHAFLSELKIKHNGLEIPKHSALEVIIGGKKYYFDTTYDKKIYEYNYSEKDKVGAYYNHPLFKGHLLQAGNPEKILLSQMFYNKGVLNLERDEYNKAIKMYNKAIELNPKKSSAYYNKGSSLHNLGKYEEAIEMYNKAIELNPKKFRTYVNKSISLLFLNKHNLSSIYIYIYIGFLKDKNYTFIINGDYFILDDNLNLGGKKLNFKIKKEVKQEIDKFVEKNNYEGLRKYLLELEKNKIINKAKK